MMNFDSADVANGFKEAFGFDIKDLTIEQAWWLVKVIKHCRGRCRNNSALYNYLNRNFPGLEFREETVTKADGDEFETLKITKKVVYEYVISEEVQGEQQDFQTRFDNVYDAKDFLQKQFSQTMEWSLEVRNNERVLVSGPFTIRAERR